MPRRLSRRACVGSPSSTGSSQNRGSDCQAASGSLSLAARRICGRPPPRKWFEAVIDRIACVHMSGLLLRSPMNAGQDGFRNASSQHDCDLEGQCVIRSVSRRGSIDHTICSSSCKFWHRPGTWSSRCAPHVRLISRSDRPRQWVPAFRHRLRRWPSASRRSAPACWRAPRRPVWAACAAEVARARATARFCFCRCGPS